MKELTAEQGLVTRWTALQARLRDASDLLELAAEENNTDVRVFGKPTTRPYRRMAVALAYDQTDTDINELRKKAKAAADLITIQ